MRAKKDAAARPSNAVARLQPRSPQSIPTMVPEASTLTGNLAGIDDAGRLLFRADCDSRPQPVGIGVQASDVDLAAAAREGRRALVVRSDAGSPELVLIALLRDRVQLPCGSSCVVTTIDGEALRLEAKSRIEIQCGDARIVLHSTGRLEISGTYVVTRSRGPNKIKGATVEIN